MAQISKIQITKPTPTELSVPQIKNLNQITAQI